eukprot:418062-Alexandrium_andersonii.AAC.1
MQGGARQLRTVESPMNVAGVGFAALPVPSGACGGAGPTLQAGRGGEAWSTARSPSEHLQYGGCRPP